jgi:predicted ATP-dependent endonuclease of OLD family
MITELEIKNYKSIRALTLPLGRINVFIGENGAGKSNILEVIALAAAAAADKLDHEFLASRGVRVTSPEFMRPAFPDADPLVAIEITTKTAEGRNVTFQLNNDNKPYSKWMSALPDGTSTSAEFAKIAAALVKLNGSNEDAIELMHALTREAINNANPTLDLSSFVIFSPENSALRVFDREGQIEPLGINGEGLLKLLSYYATKPGDGTLANVKESLRLFDWFDDFSTESIHSSARVLVRDRYLDENIKGFDHRSANEGFFFLLFYFLLFNSELTPKFFAVDNIDASLNPKLCEKLIRELSALAKANDKQAILTTHNPAVLDGLDLDDEDQRLFVVSRDRDGTTKVKRIHKPEPVDGSNLRLSELFIRGLIGGLPKGF